MLQNFADAGKALYRVARKYAAKVKTLKILDIHDIFKFIMLYCFKTVDDHNYFNVHWQAEENEMKKELLRCLDKIPAYCHQLMFTSRSLAIGQSACCRKVGALLI